jgi:hypothetical protein
MKNENKKSALQQVAATLPAEFGLRGFPGEVFRVSEWASYGPMLYVERLCDDGWRDFAKATEREIRAELVAAPAKRAR